MQQSVPSNSCTISVADDGDVAFFTNTPDYISGVPCFVRIERDVLVISQQGNDIVRVDGVSPEFSDDISKAGELCVVNVLDAGRESESMSINRQVELTGVI